jgi:hypothetical protein
MNLRVRRRFGQIERVSGSVAVPKKAGLNLPELFTAVGAANACIPALTLGPEGMMNTTVKADFRPESAADLCESGGSISTS